MAWKTDKPILVPYDFSDHAYEALKRALDIADTPTNVHVLHVVPYLMQPGFNRQPIDHEDRVEIAMDHMRDALSATEFDGIHVEIKAGDPGQVLAKRAANLDAELIVMGSHGRTGLTRALLGSVAERTCRLAHCPVLIVKLEPEQVTDEELEEVEATSF